MPSYLARTINGTAMLSILQTRYQRVEKALDKLVDSITAYNPSQTAAEELVVADEAVSEGLEDLATHHANYGRILSLRQTSAALDEQIKSTVRLLSETRKQLLDIPDPPSNTTASEVNVDELLWYAKFISKTTVPPTFRRPIPKDILSTQPSDSKPGDDPGTQITNGMATPAAGAQDGDTNVAQQGAEGVAISKLSQETKAMIDPISQLPFVPWPSQDVISVGALAHIQGMLEEGRDPSTALSKEEQDAEDQRKAEEVEQQKLEEEERLRKRRESMMAVGGSARHTVTEDVFDPDEA